MIEVSLHKKLMSANGEMKLNTGFKLEKGEFVTLYGKSGAGKTSVLRMLAGLLLPDEGRIAMNGTLWLDTNNGINLPPQKRNIGFVFQDYALFPNMTVKENLLFALGKKDKSVVDELIELVELGNLENRKPQTLSGGQQQRVALARALVQRPQLLMLDEPLSALDTEMRISLQDYILRLHREYELTTILVSHDVSEILKMSDRMLILEEGNIVKDGKPDKILLSKDVSGKFQFSGEVIGIQKQDFIFIISILIGKDLVKVVADEDEVKKLQIGDKVLVASKAFNPIIRKLP
ncbi:ATP-binding cassette domain-containing protein [Leptobacterium flavescens]|uniref:ATP-binding cassette domain-containing protein n=1 Tax=Leptobacterium flavescens TaxID=472055 RepID=A0A6P0UKC3_9FLAO|nr:ABC transporter ATP-binding protein [Leptobacterium flavescens]NER12860.1 ATP-binding cassette domain-containing protein [Leptobacterium flavescens]